MESSPETERRRAELARAAPIASRGIWKRVRLAGGEVYFLCGTIGSEYDIWQRGVSATSAADALIAQKIGLEAVERVMDGLEREIRGQLPASERLAPRRSPGYGELPLSLSREIIEELDATRRIGVCMTDSELLVPSKSVTAICAIERVNK